MRIALVDPPHSAFLGYYRLYFPLGLVSVGSMLHAAGHEVRIFDSEHLPSGRCLSNAEVSQRFDAYYHALEEPEHPIWRALVDKVRRYRPDVIGITVLSCKLESSLMSARLLRAAVPDVKVMFGGDHCAGSGRELAAEPDVDAVVMGEGEQTALELVTAWAAGRQVGGIPGVAFRKGEEVLVNPPRQLIDNLDALPAPDRSLLDDIGTYTPEDMGLMTTSRGCPYKCSFRGIAASLGRRVRFRSVENCIEEIAQTHERYGTRYFSFRDGTFTIHRRRTVTFCETLIKQRLGITWECLTRADWLDDELVKLMLDSNCVQIRLGLESGSPRILKSMQKGVSLEDYERAASILNYRGMFWSAYLMFGVPEETVDDIKMTIDMIERLQPSFITVARFVPLPGTPLFKETADLHRDIDWRWQNNMCIEQSYSRSIPPAQFQEIMQWVFEYAAKYNQARSDGDSWRDRRLRTVSEQVHACHSSAEGSGGQLPA